MSLTISQFQTMAVIHPEVVSVQLRTETLSLEVSVPKAGLGTRAQLISAFFKTSLDEFSRNGAALSAAPVVAQNAQMTVLVPAGSPTFAVFADAKNGAQNSLISARWRVAFVPKETACSA